MEETPIIWDVEMKNQLGTTAKFKAIVVDDSPKSDTYKVVLEMINQKNNDGFSHFCEFQTLDSQDLV